MSNSESFVSKTSRTNKWSEFFRSWLGIMIILGVLLFGVTTRIQFSCYPMVTGGSLPNFCNSSSAKAEIIKDPRTNQSTFERMSADPHENGENIGKVYSTPNKPVSDNPPYRTYLIAKNPTTPEYVLLDLASSGDLEVLKNLQVNPSAMNNPKVKARWCSNPLVKKTLGNSSCDSPLPPSCLGKHAVNLLAGVAIGFVGLLAAPVFLPSVVIGETVVAASTVGLFGGASSFFASTGLLEAFTKC